VRPLVLLLLLAHAACGLGEFDVIQTINQQTIEGSPLGGVLPAGFFEVPIDITIDTDIAAQGTGPVDEIRLNGLELDNTAGGGWSFLDSVELFVSSRRQGTTLPPNIRIATGAGTVSSRLVFIPVPGVNLVDYINEGARITAQAMGTAPEDDVTFTGSAVFHVEPL
jgi:hypothetical protein